MRTTPPLRTQSATLGTASAWQSYPEAVASGIIPSFRGHNFRNSQKSIAPRYRISGEFLTPLYGRPTTARAVEG